MESIDVFDQINALGEEPGNLGDAFVWQIKRVGLIRDEYLRLPNNSGAFAAMAMKANLDQAIEIQAVGDVVAMLQCYQDLKGWEL